ncbi:MAG: transposase [Candidatus Omnitrophota bacterium]|nr:transposase [Candidatus Omnitrophota bacterium]
MARPLRIEYPGAFYHVIQRGNEKKNIFLSEQDRLKFYEYLAILHIRYKVNIHTYCLMRNHYHLIMETENANLASAMHYLNTSYTVYFNLKSKRTGHLFQGRYKAILVEADEYLHQLSRYIHLNPVRAGLVKDPANYPHSSYKYFVSTQKRPGWLKTNFILSMFDASTKKAMPLYKKFILEGIGNETDIIRKNVSFGFLLGGQDFMDDIKSRFIEGKDDPEIPVLKAAQYRLSPEAIKEMVTKKIGENKLSRKVCIYLIRKHTALSLKKIAGLFDGIGDAGVSVLCRRIDDERTKDKKLNSAIVEMEKLLKVET